MRIRTLVLITGALLLVAAEPAAAQREGDWYEQCYGPDGPTLEEAETTRCVKVGDGRWERVGDSGATAGPGLALGPGEILLFAILLALVPGFVGAAVSSSANVSPVAGFFIGTFGSWLGVIGLYLYGHSQKRGSVIQVGPAVEQRPADTAAERLRTLQELLDQGLITQEEYQARRRAAIEGL